jgi:inner membrane protein
MEHLLRSIKHWLMNSAFLRVLFICFVMLLLQIPIEMIDSQVRERNYTRLQAISDVTSKWGYGQNITGPRLVIPYYKIKTWLKADGKSEQIRSIHYASFLPEELNFHAHVKNEVRYRGIFEVPLYQTEIDIKGHFTKPDFRKLGIDHKTVLWDKAELLVGVSDARGIQKQAYLSLNGKSYAFEPGMGKSEQKEQGFHIPLTDNFEKDRYQYQTKLILNGSDKLFVAPIGKNTQIKITSDWPDPSFQGNILPGKRTISASGFNAEWNITSISRQYPQAWLNESLDHKKITQSMVGVNFISPVDNYRMTDRSIKYVMLFLLFTFIVIWLMEITSKVRVHLLQYLLLGLGLCLFYLLLLAFSEHIGFTWAYIISSLAVISMIGSYSMTILKTGKHAAIISVGVAALYIYLYSLLQEQNYSLLFGSLGVFTALAAVMYITRNIDWYTPVNPDTEHRQASVD